jgi:hypothetical protein
MPAPNEFATRGLPVEEGIEAIRAKLRTQRALLRYATEPKRQALWVTIARAEHELASLLIANPPAPLSDDGVFPNIAASKIESLRQMVSRLLAAAETAIEPSAKRHLAMRALELAQEAEALARSW